MPSYATAGDVVSRYDIRRLSQFLSDTGTPVCTNAQIAAGTCASTLMPANTNLLNLIKDASNKVLMSCRVANRYLQSDLDRIYADTDRRESLVRVVCDLTFGYVMMRRGLGLREVSNLAPGFDDAVKTLEMLERGLLVFDDSPPDGTDAPLAGAEVDVVQALGTQQSGGQFVRLRHVVDGAGVTDLPGVRWGVRWKMTERDNLSNFVGDALIEPLLANLDMPLNQQSVPSQSEMFKAQVALSALLTLVRSNKDLWSVVTSMAAVSKTNRDGGS